MILIGTALFCTVLYADSYTVGRVTADKLNLRAGPATSHPVLGSVTLGQHVIICQEKGSWLRIFFPRYFHVWVHGDHLKITSTETGQYKQATTIQKTVAKDDIDQGAVDIGTIPAGITLKLVKQLGKWWSVVPPLCLTCYVNKNYVRTRQTLAASDVTLFSGGRKILPIDPFPELEKTSVTKNDTGTAKPAPAVLRSTKKKKTEGAPVHVDRKSTDKNDTITSDPKAEYRTGKHSGQRIVRQGVINNTEKIIELKKEYAEVMRRSDDIEQWNYTALRAKCADLLASTDNQDEKYLAEKLIEEIDFIESVRKVLNSPKKTRGPDTIHLGKPDNKYIAVGWVTGQGKYLGKPGTHVLKKGNKVLYYLQGQGTVLEACVNKRIAITRGSVEDLPPKYGCKMINVHALDVLSE